MAEKDLIYNAISEELLGRLRKSRRITRNLEEALADFKKRRKNGGLTFLVALNSLWSKEGEKNIKVKTKGDLKEAIEEAEEKFKKINHRQDVQADYSIFVLLANGVRIRLSEDFWDEYKK